MPKMSERDRLNELEARKLKIHEEIETARAQLRERYALIVRSLPVERISEREFRAIIEKAVSKGDDRSEQPRSQPASGMARKASSASERVPSGAGERPAPSSKTPIMPAPA